jgi:hypothetical protein
MSLYGLPPVQNERAMNNFLSVAYLFFAHDNADKFPVFGVNSKFETFRFSTERFKQGLEICSEQPCNMDPRFVNPPPNDVTWSDADGKAFVENKVCMFKGKGTELIIRQDCAFNVIQQLLLRNKDSAHTFTTVDDFLTRTSIVETPYLFTVIVQTETFALDLVVFTDMSLLKHIVAMESPRSREIIKIMNRYLSSYCTEGSMAYKPTKTSTVPHQKVSLFPFRNKQLLESLAFPVKIFDLVLKPVKPDFSIWNTIYSLHLKHYYEEKLETITRSHEEQLEALKLYYEERLFLKNKTNDERMDP